MHCSNCSKSYEDNSLRFCTECGTPLSEVPTISDPKHATIKMGDELVTQPIAVGFPQLEVTVQPEAGERTTSKQNEWVGTKGFHRALEGFSLQIVPQIPGLSLRYMAHFQDIGDTEFVNEGEFLSASGTEARRLEGFAIELTGPKASKFEISYWAHIQAWQDSREYTDGEFCGSRGRGLRVEAIKVSIAPVIKLETQAEVDRELAKYDDYHPLYRETSDPQVWRIRAQRHRDSWWTVIECRASFLRDKLRHGLEPTE